MGGWVSEGGGGGGCHFYKNTVCSAFLKIHQFKVAIRLFFPLTYSLAKPSFNYNDKLNQQFLNREYVFFKTILVIANDA